MELFQKTGVKARIFNLVFWSVLFAYIVWGVGAVMAFEAVPSTPDITVTNGATSTINFGRTPNYIYLKNDCASDVYIDLRGRGTNYPLRLKGGEVFQAEIQTSSIGVSPAAAATGCTLTVIPAR